MNDTYQPREDDVEAAAKAIPHWIDRNDDDRRWIASDVAAALHARGWRDPAEVAAIVAEAEKKFTAANQRAIQLERNAVLTTNGLAFAAAAVERDAAEARAARLAAAANKLIAEWRAQGVNNTSRMHYAYSEVQAVCDAYIACADELTAILAADAAEKETRE